MNTPWPYVVALATSLLSWPSDAQTVWKETVLGSFNGTNGAYPSASLILDASGNLYGTTNDGGAFGYGTVFKLTPPAKGKTVWTQTVLFSFNKASGAGSYAGLIFDAKGNLYGTTDAGGKSGDGTVFKLTPPAAGKTAWTKTVLFSFNNSDGANPDAGLISDAAGNLYGTTNQGGNLNDCNGYGCGTVFKLTPPAAGKTAWTETVLFAFNNSNGANPQGSLIFDAKGNLYGTTVGGGNLSATCFGYGCGTVFKLAPPVAGKTAWTETVLVVFNGTDGESPQTNLIFDAAGNLYGTTDFGGPAFSSSNPSAGTIFKLTPPAAGKTAWTETILTSFGAVVDLNPFGGLIFDKAGNLYGTTDGGGKSNAGMVIKLTPPAKGKSVWTETVLFSFNGTDGESPQANLIFDAKGSLYSTTVGGRASNRGTVFELTP